MRSCASGQARPRSSAGAVQGPSSGLEPSEADNERLLDAVVPIKQPLKDAGRFEGGGMRFQRWLTEIAALPATHQQPASAAQGAIAQVVFEEVRRHTPAHDNKADALALLHWAIAEQGHG